MWLQSAFITVALVRVSIVIANDSLDELKAIEKFELLGGKVIRNDTLPERPVIGIDLLGRKITSDDSRSFKQEQVHQYSFESIGGAWTKLILFGRQQSN